MSAWSPGWVAVAATVGCSGSGLADHPVRSRVIAVEQVASLDLDLVMPSDALLRDDGSVLVLDGYGGRVLWVDAAAATIAPLSTGSFGRASRLAPAADGGVWVTLPGTAEEAGSLLHLDARGARLGVKVPRTADGAALHPVDVLDLGETLVVADRSQGLVWIGADGVVESVVSAAADRPLRRVVDLVAVPSGFVGVDTLSPGIVSRLERADAWTAFGHLGLSVGTFARPTAAASVPGGLLVSDSVLGVVQAFEADGDPVGVLGDGAEPLRLGHPIAVRTNPAVPGLVVVLEANPARLRLLRLPGALPPAELSPLLRTTLVAADADPVGEDGASCSTCHDGLVLDSRQLWDPARPHHPVDVVPEKEIPSFFPLDAQGRITCRTCHSPHGVVDDAADDPDPLVRHVSPEDPFMRLDSTADALCVACHTSDAHRRDPVAGDRRVGGGHPAGAALVAALEKRGHSTTDLTKARCLSCHATHGAATDGLLRSTDEAAACVGCHDTQRAVATNHPLGRVPGKDLVLATAGGDVPLAGDGGVGCQTCHDLTSPGRRLLRTLPGGEPVCLECHDERSGLSGGPHGALAKVGTITCVACHDLHGAERQAHFVATGPTSAADPRGCLSCHDDAGRARPSVLGHPVTGAPIEPAVDGTTTLDCLACHDPHLADKPKSPDCVTCHAEQGTAKQAGGHGSAECLDCHGAHTADPAWSGPENPASGRCLACHAASKATADVPAVTDYAHPPPMFLPGGERWTPLGGLVLYAPDGNAVPAAQNGDLTCQSCHVVHGPDGAADHLRRATGWQDSCAACHGQDALVFYRNFHSPERRASLTGGTP